MRAHQAQFPVATMCEVLRVSRSGFYAWLTRPLSARAKRDRELTNAIRASHVASDGIYGAPRVHADLRADGLRVGKKRVARLMREAGLVGVSRRRGPTTTVRSKSARQGPDLVERDFTAEWSEPALVDSLGV